LRERNRTSLLHATGGKSMTTKRLFMRRLAIPTIAAAVLLTGCRRQSTTSESFDEAAVATEIRAARDAYFHAATVSMDADAMVGFWDKDFIHVSNAYVQPLTLEDLRDGWRTLSRIEMNLTSDRVVALSRNSGYTLSTASYTVYDTSGVALEQSDWAGTHIWVRTEEGWRVQAVHEGRPVGN
jgi:hypothetical protein